MDKFDQNILNICHSYNRFQKVVIDSNSNFFLNSNVLVRINPLKSFTKLLPNNSFDVKNKINLYNKPKNMKIYKTKVLYFPGNNQYKKLGIKHLKKVNVQIKEQRIKFNIIHSQFLWSSGYVGYKLKKTYDVPFIVNARGYDIYKLPFIDEDWLYRIDNVLESADHVIAVSKKNLVLAKKIKKNVKVSLIPNGVNNNLFYPRSTQKSRQILRLPKKKKIVTFIGNLIKIKGIPYLLYAFNKLNKKNNDVILIIIGHGVLDNKIRRIIRKLNLSNKIFLVGKKKHQDIPLWINSSDLVVLPSLNEGNPNVMFETLSCGKPFIGTDVGGIRDIIVNDKLGYVIEPKNSNSLALNIDKGLQRDWDRNYIYNYSKRFSLEEVRKKYYTIFKNVLDKYY